VGEDRIGLGDGGYDSKGVGVRCADRDCGLEHGPFQRLNYPGCMEGEAQRDGPRAARCVGQGRPPNEDGREDTHRLEDSFTGFHLHTYSGRWLSSARAHVAPRTIRRISWQEYSLLWSRQLLWVDQS